MISLNLRSSWFPRPRISVQSATTRWTWWCLRWYCVL
uniref:Uncharacterized protein n=1 Tax=Anguilla anguilla TaxID=7936 RepID=A0A0E9S2C7_ANGAN